MAGIKKAALISEAGWKGVRELSLSLLKSGFPVDIIIKGSVDKEVLEIITRPEGLRIRTIPKIFFKPWLFFYLLLHKIANDLKMIAVSKEDTKNWVKRFGFETQLLTETAKGYEVTAWK